MITRDHAVPEVWAPGAQRVDATVDGTDEAMSPVPGRPGWWTLHRALAPGSRYAFRLDCGDPLPDPRSLAQPDGVHGPSATIDPACLTDRPHWAGIELRGAVGYELHVGTFTAGGTFDSAIEKLDHVAGLGVDYVEVMPVATFPGDRGWGYDGVGQYAVHAAYGGPEAFVRFIDAAHARGLGVVLDVVHNHQGPEGNYLAAFGPYFTDQHHTPWGDAVNLDGTGSAEVRAFLLGAVRQWLVDFRVDGLRLDAVHALLDDSEPHFLAELSGMVARLEDETGRPFILIAESDLNQPAMVSPVGSVPDARGMDAQWADDVHHALHSFFTGETQGYYVDFGTAEVLAKALTRAFVHDGGRSTFRGTDWGAPVDPTSSLIDGHSFVTSLQNHDQIGNRATGDRLGHTVPAGAQAAGAALNLLGPFAPLLFMGEEWNTTAPFPYFSHLGPELGPKVTEGRAREFEAMGWQEPTPDPQDEATFRSAVLHWGELDAASDPAHTRMHRWYRDLLGIRREHEDARNPRLNATAVEIVDDDTLVMRRGRLAVVATRVTTGSVTVPLGAQARILASWDELPRNTVADVVVLPGPGAVVVQLL